MHVDSRVLNQYSRQRRFWMRHAPSALRVLVQGYTSRENVSRFARNRGCEVEVQEKDKDEFEITLKRTESEIVQKVQEEILACPVPEQSQDSKIVVYVGNNCMGRGDDELGKKLMRGFLRTWIDISPRPWRMIFINSGVKLTTIDEEAAEAVSMLEEKGCRGSLLRHLPAALWHRRQIEGGKSYEYVRNHRIAQRGRKGRVAGLSNTFLICPK